MKHWKKLVVTTAVFAALALFAGCASAQSQPTTQTRVTLEQARDIAYTHAGVSESEARDKSYENDDGVYEIDFEHGGFDYEYDISYSGEILKSEKNRLGAD